ncbi:conserved hypothetical protein [Ricinus communis]|uniref:Uncharacterized protein n=1 Tax=Ricinus communis TaxID=3988 RepID=B9RR18_RICCO|nr:conserved hypothetical protein [Ricinus communis]
MDIPSSKTNLCLWSYGSKITIITASRNVVDGSTKHNSATVDNWVVRVEWKFCTPYIDRQRVSEYLTLEGIQYKVIISLSEAPPYAAEKFIFGKMTHEQ